MPIVHQNCYAGRNCYAAFAATLNYGLFYTESLVYDDDSHPDWEYVGNTAGLYGGPLPIKQFAWNVDNPAQMQVCLDHNNQGYIRFGASTGLWDKIIDGDIVRTTLAANGFPIVDDHGDTLPVVLGWMDCWKGKTAYCTVLCGGLEKVNSGQYFFKTDDAGSNWYSALIYQSDDRCDGPGAIGIQHAATETQAGGTVIFASVHNSFGDVGGFVYSKDRGTTWGPRDPVTGEIKPYFGLGFVSNYQRPIASRKYINACYGGKYRNPRDMGRYCVRIDNWCSTHTDKDPAENKTGWTIGGAVWLSDTGNYLYVGDDKDIWFTKTLESQASPTWTNRINRVNSDIKAISAHSMYNRLIVGLDGFRSYSEADHVVVTTENDFITVRKKAGEFYNKTGTNTGAISYDSGGVSWNGVATWDVADPVVEPPIPPSGYAGGWPIWINSKARELVPDPSWDRLYVMSETVWPNGSGLWNQPILFQFVISGYVGDALLENAGRLAFVPTFAQGMTSMYSGDITYAGSLDAHTNAPLVHEVIVAGKFDTADQVRYTDDITLATGILLGNWPIVGAFAASHVSSVNNLSTITDDVTITYGDAIDQPSNIAPTPWEWTNLTDLPFTVNFQFREAGYVWVGAKGVGVTNPVQFTVTTSGGGGWTARSGGLPLVPITDITRGE